MLISRVLRSRTLSLDNHAVSQNFAYFQPRIPSDISGEVLSFYDSSRRNLLSASLERVGKHLVEAVAVVMSCRAASDTRCCTQIPGGLDALDVTWDPKSWSVSTFYYICVLKRDFRTVGKDSAYQLTTRCAERIASTSSGAPKLYQ